MIKTILARSAPHRADACPQPVPALVACLCDRALRTGRPLRAYFGDRVEKMSVDERAWAEAKLGLDRPVLTQYGIWLQNALHGDFGISYKYKMDVLEVIRTRLPYTLRLGGVGFVLLFVLSLGVGVLCARARGFAAPTAFSAAWARS